jgi:uncharacterized membrane protein
MKEKNHDLGRIVLFYIVTLGLWVPLTDGEMTTGVFLFGLVAETAILYYLLGLYSSGIKSE